MGFCPPSMYVHSFVHHCPLEKRKKKSQLAPALLCCLLGRRFSPSTFIRTNISQQLCDFILKHQYTNAISWLQVFRITRGSDLTTTLEKKRKKKAVDTRCIKHRSNNRTCGNLEKRRKMFFLDLNVISTGNSSSLKNRGR